MSSLVVRIRRYSHTTLLSGAILVGTVLGNTSNQAASFADQWLDYAILALVTLLFAEVPLTRIRLGKQDRVVMITLWIANFAVIPFLGYGLAKLFLHGHELAMIGLIIYFMSPCTDWFLGFTRLAGGNTSLGLMFIPISMATQLALYPVYIWLFTSNHVSSQIGETGATIYSWFIIPIIIAGTIQVFSRLASPPIRTQISGTISELTTIAILTVVLCVFAGNGAVILDQIDLLPRTLAAVFGFFVLTWFLGERISSNRRFSYENRALISISTAARNAPLMLAITTVAIPNQPLIYAALVVGMLLEFPHLTLLTELLNRSRTAKMTEEYSKETHSGSIGNETSTQGGRIW